MYTTRQENAHATLTGLHVYDTGITYVPTICFVVVLRVFVFQERCLLKHVQHGQRNRLPCIRNVYDRCTPFNVWVRVCIRELQDAIRVSAVPQNVWDTRTSYYIIIYSVVVIGMCSYMY